MKYRLNNAISYFYEMRKIFCLTLVLMITTSAELFSQQYSKGYSDSVRAFYQEWIQNQQDFVYSVMDNTTFRIGDFILNRFKEYSTTPCTIFHTNSKRRLYGIDEKRKYSIDSIILTNQEIELAQKKIIESFNFKWSKEFFAQTTDIVDSIHYFLALKNTPFGTHKPDFWILSLPFFFRSGMFCMIHYMYYCGPDCGYETVAFYKKEGNNWQLFGTLFDGIF